jgi:hypothetical protein
MILHNQPSTSTLTAYFQHSSSPDCTSKRSFTPDFEHLDLKRDYVMSHFVTVGLRVRFEGFEEELHEEQQKVSSALKGQMSHVEMGKLGMLVARKALSEDASLGKKLNIEVKKLIKANKEK